MITKNNKKIDKIEIIVFIYMIIMSLECAVEFYSSQQIGWALLIYRCCAILCPIVTFIIFTKTKIYKKSYEGRITWYFLFLCIWSLIIYIWQDFNVLSTFSACIYFAIPLGVYISNLSIYSFSRIFQVISIIGISCFIYVWAVYDIDITIAMRRGYAWSNIFYWAGVFWGIIPNVLLAFIQDNNKILSVIYWGCGVLFNLIFLKRFIIVDSVLLIFMLVIYYFLARKIKISTFIKGMCILIIGIIILLSVQGSVIDMLINSSLKRFTNLNIMEFDRFVESINYFKEINPLFLLFGKGIWGTHTALNGLREALHVGWSNFIFKGGIPLISFALVPTIKAIKMLPKMYLLDQKTQWAVCIVCVYAVKLIYSSVHGFSPETLMLFFSYAAIMKYRYKN